MLGEGWLVKGAVVVTLTVIAMVPEVNLAHAVAGSIAVAQVSSPEPATTEPLAEGGPGSPPAVGSAQSPSGSGLENEGGTGGGYSYDPSGRRDPFSALIKSVKGAGDLDKSLPPLQRVGLTEITLIGVVWGGFGYTAMVQTPDGRGYAVRRGTRIGPNNGVVTKISEKGIVVTERFTDIYGKDQEREHLKLLRSEEGSE